MKGFTDIAAAEPGMNVRITSPVSMPCVMLAPAAHHAVLSNDTSSSTTVRELKAQIRETETLVYAIGIDGEGGVQSYRPPLSPGGQDVRVSRNDAVEQPIGERTGEPAVTERQQP